MPRINGPLHSDSATGSVANAYTFRKSRRGNICVKKSKPSGFPTALQTAVRTFTGRLMHDWKALDDSAKASWHDRADVLAISPINAYLQENYSRRHRGLSTIAYCPTAAGVRIYSGGTQTPNLANWTSLPGLPGELSLINGEVFAAQHVTVVDARNDTTLDGLFDLRGMDAITEIDLGGGGEDACNITSPPIVHGLKTLQVLRLDCCPITSWPDLSDLPAFSVADFSGDPVTKPMTEPPILPDTVTILDLDGDMILTMPDLTGKTLLEEIDLSGPIRTATSLANCQALQNFAASYASFTTPPDFRNLAALLSILLTNNPFTQTLDFTGSPNVEEINLTSTPITAIPTIATPAALKKIILTSCHLAAGQPDALFNLMYAAWGDTVVPTYQNIIKTDGATNAVATSASANARTKLLAAHWLISCRL